MALYTITGAGLQEQLTLMVLTAITGAETCELLASVALFAIAGYIRNYLAPSLPKIEIPACHHRHTGIYLFIVPEPRGQAR